MFSEDLRWRVVFLIWDGFRHKEVASLLRMSLRTVTRIWNMFEETGMVMSRFHNTRSGIMREEDYLCLYDHVLANPTSYLDEMACEVNSFRAENGGLPAVSLATICRALTMLNLSRKKSQNVCDGGSVEAASTVHAAHGEKGIQKGTFSVR